MLERERKSNIFYLLDIEDACSYQDIIKKMHAKNVTNLSIIVAREDDQSLIENTYYMNLISTFKNLGVVVDDILTIADLFYRDAFDVNDFNPGDAYRKFIYPLEQSVSNLKYISKNTIDKYKEYYANKNLINALCFLRDFQFVSHDEKLSFLNQENTYTILRKIERHIIERNNQTETIDYKIVLQDSFRLLSAEENIDVTLNDVIEKHEKFDAKLFANLPITSQKNKEKIKHYFTELKDYSNRFCYAYFVLRHRDDNAYLRHGEYSKSDIYAWYAANNYLNVYDWVIFISDSKDTNEAVEKSHEYYGFKNSLETVQLSKFYPTYWKNFDFSFNYHMKNCLITHLRDENRSKMSDDILKNYIHHIYTRGMTAQTHQDALDSLMLAYLLYEDRLDASGDAINKNTIIQSILQFNKKNQSQSYYEGGSDSYGEILQAGGFTLEIKVVDLNIALHKAYHPTCYQDNDLSFLSKSISLLLKLGKCYDEDVEADWDFKLKIIVRVVNVADKYKDQRQACILYLNNLLSKMSSPVYRDYIIEKRDVISRKCNEREMSVIHS